MDKVPVSPLVSFFLYLETAAAALTGATWAFGATVVFFESMPHLPISVSLHQLFWVPLAIWAVPFVIARSFLPYEDIEEVSWEQRKPELVAFVLGVLLGLPTSIWFQVIMLRAAAGL